MNWKFYVNVKDLMNTKQYGPFLPPKIFITGWNEWLPLIKVETEV